MKILIEKSVMPAADDVSAACWSAVSESYLALLTTSTVGKGQRLTLPVMYLATSYHLDR